MPPLTLSDVMLLLTYQPNHANHYGAETMTTIDRLSQSDATELRQYAIAHGRTWRMSLRAVWGSRHELGWQRRVRNVIGPRELSSVKV